MAPAVFTIVWLEVNEDDLNALQEAGRPHGVRFVEANRKSLESKIIEARARGAVVALVAGDDEAGRAFQAGADVVLRSGETAWDHLTSALDQAAQVAALRMRRMLGDSTVDLEPTAFSMLMRALCRQVSESLTTAWSQYESIAERMEDVRKLNVKLAEWAALSAPPQEFQQLRNRSKALLSREVQDMLESASGSLHRAEAALENAQVLSTGSPRTPVDVTIVLEELAELLRDEVRNWADLRVRGTVNCEARVPVTFLVCLVTAVIAIAVDAFREASQWDGRIEIRTSVEDGILVLELHDNGPRFMEDLDSASQTGATRGAQLARIRERIRAFGAEMLVESSEVGTVVRVYVGADDTTLAEARVDLVSTRETPDQAGTRLHRKN